MSEQSGGVGDKPGKIRFDSGLGKLILIMRSENAVLAVLVMMLCPEARMTLLGF